MKGESMRNSIIAWISGGGRTDLSSPFDNGGAYENI